ncbi:pantothenate synthetase [Hathewaya proteolytica DSM 3090]|uniref:Pantothenate synthetase n=1 Tax=Hathewaya proteolytica DSM 3090 TaxID=1121331 RepID=A0A1M6KNX8_9CLOT|nr:pantoate--beta-alanine ligase [Hathewaya proteolytica]SHJ60713.1 pantothenate synthetase [Hathewaya proteolytica DSM 3090]
MQILKTINEVKILISQWKSAGLTIGLVPTMGYLHQGHKSLIERAVKENNRVIVSDFVNPIQFGPSEDLATYPRDLAHDSKLCESAGASAIFNPEPSEMYPMGTPLTHVAVEEITSMLCGAKRPGHFQGVCTVVSKLFNIVQPDKAYFGEKDAQQLSVIRTMVKDLNFPIEIVGCPIVREKDGLAKSSRNTYLNIEERRAALILSKSLKLAEKLIQDGEKSSDKIKEAILNSISTEKLAKTDYVEIVDFDTIKPTSEIKHNTLIAIAVYIGKTRLIDNIIIK